MSAHARGDVNKFRLDDAGTLFRASVFRFPTCRKVCSAALVIMLHSIWIAPPEDVASSSAPHIGDFRRLRV